MNKTEIAFSPYFTLRDNHVALGKAVDAALESLRKLKLPENLRPATAADVVVDAVLWYPEFDEEDGNWLIVETVLSPYDPYKAFEAHDGCRYGLDGAFVEYDA